MNRPGGTSGIGTRRTVRLLCALSVLISVALPTHAQDLILCICEDGYVSLESSCDPAGCCKTEAETTESLPDAFPSDMRITGLGRHCTDIPLVTADNPGAIRIHPVFQAGSSRTDLLTATLDPVLPATHSLNRLASSLLFLRNPNTRLRTVVLLI